MRLSIYQSLVRNIAYASLGYTNCYYGLFDKPGNPSIYKTFYQMEIWKLAEGDPEENKQIMIEPMQYHIPQFLSTGGLYTIYFNDDWWKEFIKQHLHDIYDKIEWNRFTIPEEDLFTKMRKIISGLDSFQECVPEII